MREEDLGETWPEIPEWASVDELAPDVMRDLRGLSKEGAEFVALHLVAAGTLAEEEPELAWRHARAARSKGGRIAVVRETVGLVAYRAGEWAETISELRAARRMGGGPGHLAVMADSERALGNPEKAIEMSRSTEAAELDDDAKLELTIVVAGARADLGQIDTAMVVLEGSGVLEDDADARLLYAYADLLAAAERTEEALDWFMKAHDADEDDETDAAERIAELAAGDDDGDSDDDDSDDDDSDDDNSDDDNSDDDDSDDDGDDSDDDQDGSSDDMTDVASDEPSESEDDRELSATSDIEVAAGDDVAVIDQSDPVDGVEDEMSAGDDSRDAEESEDVESDDDGVDVDNSDEGSDDDDDDDDDDDYDDDDDDDDDDDEDGDDSDDEDLDDDDDSDAESDGPASVTEQDSSAPATGPAAAAVDLPLFSDDPKNPPLFSDDPNEHR